MAPLTSSIEKQIEQLYREFLDAVERDDEREAARAFRLEVLGLGGSEPEVARAASTRS